MSMDLETSVRQAEAQPRTTVGETRMADPPPYPGTPHWVKVSGIIASGLVAVAIILAVTGIGGPHGPGRHNLEYQQGQER